jgi:membrane associated rhomboid family serine protease
VVFIPVSDDNPLRSIHLQWVTISLIAANAIVFLLARYHTEPAALASFALVPAELFGGATPVPGQAVQVPEVLTLLTYQFMHVDALHLASNMLFLWVFGDNVEDAMGHLKFLAFYLLSGVAGGLAHAALWPASAAPLIGASGAVAGVIAAYLMLHPRVRVWVLAFRFIPMKIAAVWVLGVWAAMQIVMVFVAPRDPPIAWWAHVGGMGAGAVLVLFLRRRGVSLFDRGLQASAAKSQLAAARPRGPGLA